MMVVDTLAYDANWWRCYTSTPLLGRIAIATARIPELAQYQAAKFLDANFPGEPVIWGGGYHGGDTSKESALPQNTYWKTT
jgi:hypothetical protein